MAEIRKVLIIDGNQVAWANHCALRHLKTGDTLTGAFFGTLKQVRAAITELKPTAVCVLWDTGRTWRHDALEEYKGDRTSPGDALYTQMDSLRQAFHSLGVRQLRAEGFEADDIAAYLVSRRLDTEHYILMTTDRDWFQLLRDGVSVYEPKMKKHITSKEFFEYTGVNTPEELVVKKILLGDSDNIPGLDGVGQVKIKQYLDGTAPAALKKQIDDHLASDKGILYRALIQLLVPVMQETDVFQIEPHPDQGAFELLAQSYAAKSLLGSWSAPFKALT